MELGLSTFEYELLKNIVLSPNMGMEFPINWWSENIK